jgi:magnesium chelatase subunit D
MKLALLLNAIAPRVGGVLVMGERGTGKSTAVRALAELLPPLAVVRGCTYNCDPASTDSLCAECRARLEGGGRLPRETARVPVVELPLGATEDRVCGTLDVGRALRDGARTFEPGLLARANRGFLYIDEVNLLEDHLVDLLLDVSVTGVNRVEREGVSLEHPSRFVLVGSGNPEEGELRPQLLDRFGLSVEVRTPAEVEERVQVVERCERFDADPEGFADEFRKEQDALRRRLVRARKLYDSVSMPRALLRRVAELCRRLGVDGHRGELTLTRAARALAAFEGRGETTEADVRRVAPLALSHRLRKDPLEQSPGGGRVGDAVDEVLGQEDAAHAEGGTNAAEPGRRVALGDRGRKPEDDASTREARAEPLPRGVADPSGDGAGGASRVAPPAEVDFDDEDVAVRAHVGKGERTAASRARRKSSPDGSMRSTRGRYAGSTARPDTRAPVALDATLRAVAQRAASRGDADARTPPRAQSDDIRRKRFKSRAGTLYVFAVDASGSMALNRIGQAKGVVAHLLRKSYVNRDRVALVGFRERAGSVLLRPSGSAARARRILDALPAGGATPLASGLLNSLELIRRAKGAGAGRVVLMVFTDGRGNVPLSVDAAHGGPTAARTQSRAEVRKIGAEFRRERVASLVVDTGNRFTSSGEGEELAAALGGRYVRLPSNVNEQNIGEVMDF